MDSLRSWRCDACNRKLADYEMYGGTVRVVIKCEKCGAINAKSVAETIILEYHQGIALTKQMC